MYECVFVFVCVCVSVCVCVCVYGRGGGGGVCVGASVWVGVGGCWWVCVHYVTDISCRSYLAGHPVQSTFQADNGL